MSERLPPSVRAVIEEICATHEVDRDEVLSSERGPRNVSNARQAAMYELCIRPVPGSNRYRSTIEVGRLFGRDHSTVTHACQREAARRAEAAAEAAAEAIVAGHMEAAE